MTNLAMVHKTDSGLSLEEPGSLTLDDIGRHYFQRPVLERDLEELVRRFPAYFLSSDDEDEPGSTLIVGQQVSIKAGGKADIVAVDSTGALVLVE